jgi:hypothetical protein
MGERNRESTIRNERERKREVERVREREREREREPDREGQRGTARARTHDGPGVLAGCQHACKSLNPKP